MVDHDNLVTPRRRETDPQHIFLADAGVQRDAPPSGAVRVDQLADVACDAMMMERIDDELALPCPIGIGLPMLNRTAAADPEMRTERRDALRAGRDDLRQHPPIRMPGRWQYFDGFVGQRIRHIHRLAVDHGDAIAALADMIDGETFGHFRPGMMMDAKMAFRHPEVRALASLEG